MGTDITFVQNFMSSLNNIIQFLYLERCSLGNYGAIAVASYVKINTKCKVVSLKSNAIECRGARAFEEVLTK